MTLEAAPPLGGAVRGPGPDDDDADELVRIAADLGPHTSRSHWESDHEPMTPVERVGLLQGCDAFAETPCRVVAAIAAQASERWVETGRVIIEAGATGRLLFIVASGGARAETPGDAGARLVGQGDRFGDHAFLQGSRQAETVMASEPTRLLVLDRQDVDRALRAWPHFEIQAPSGGDEPPGTVDRSTADGSDPPRGGGVGRRVALLATQALTWGLTLGFVIVPGSALFLNTYGSGLLPVSYLVVALFGGLLGLTVPKFQRDWPLTILVVANPVIMALWIGGSWFLIDVANQRWAAFGLPILFNLEIQAGFVTLGGQAGRLLDVRQIKRLYPLILAGKGAGFLVAGLLAPLIGGAIGTVRVLLVTTACAVVLLASVLATIAAFGSELAAVPAPDPKVTRPNGSFLRLLRDPYVAMLVWWQIAANVVRQLVDFLVYERAGARYESAEELASFVGGFSALLNTVDLLFVLVAAGFLIARFGLRFGLLVNSAVVGGLLVAGVATSTTAGIDSTLFFALVASARVADISLNDGATVTSLNAAYQPLTVGERLRVRMGVEVVGVPIAVGMTGALLLIFSAVPRLGPAFVTGFAAVAAVAWTVIGIVVHRRYRSRLVSRLAIGGDTKAADWRPPELLGPLRPDDRVDTTYCIRLLDHLADPNPIIRAETVERLGHVEALSARDAVASALVDPDPGVRSKAVTVCCRRREFDQRRLRRWLTDPEPEVQIAALAGLNHSGDRRLIQLGNRRLLNLVHRADRPLAMTTAGLIAGCETQTTRFLRWTFEHGSRAAAVPVAERVLSACRFSDDRQTGASLLPLIAHGNPRVSGAAALAVLHAGHRPTEADRPLILSVLQAEIDYAVLLLGARGGRPTGILGATLDEEFAQLRQRVFTLLGLLHGRTEVATARDILTGRRPGDRALAIEAIEVSVNRDLGAAVVAVIGHDGSHGARLRALGGSDPDRRPVREQLFIAPGRSVAHDWLCASIVAEVERADLKRFLAGTTTARHLPGPLTGLTVDHRLRAVTTVG